MDDKNCFAIRTYTGELLGTAPDLVTANRRSRGFGQCTKVYKVTPKKEVLMSYTGPRDNNLK